MVIEPTCVAFEDRLRYIRGSGDAALFAPHSEAAQMLLASADGLLGVVLHPHPFQMRGRETRHPARVGDVARRHLRFALSAPAHQRAPCACLRFAATYDGAVSAVPISGVSSDEASVSRFTFLAATVDSTRPPPDTP